MSNITPKHPRPLSPNIQHYRPQLTSVLSIANRLTGVVLNAFAVGLVVWLTAGATGPRAYAVVQIFLASWVGQVILFGCTFAFFLHLCGGVRHLVWDTVHGCGSASKVGPWQSGNYHKINGYICYACEPIGAVGTPRPSIL